jgi:hypothetical protein
MGGQNRQSALGRSGQSGGRQGGSSSGMSRLGQMLSINITGNSNQVTVQQLGNRLGSGQTSRRTGASSTGNTLRSGQAGGNRTAGNGAAQGGNRGVLNTRAAGWARTTSGAGVRRPRGRQRKRAAIFVDSSAMKRMVRHGES